MFKRGAAPATARSPVASRTPLSGSGEERTARRVEGVARGRLAVGPGHVLGGGVGRAPRGAAVGARERLPVGQDTCSGGEGGHLEVLQWARANGCPWGKRTCWSGGGGHLEVLKWARANGCPCDEGRAACAAQNGHEAVVRALIEAGADVNKAGDDGATPLFIAAETATRRWCGR